MYRRERGCFVRLGSLSYSITGHTGPQRVCPEGEHVWSLWPEYDTCRPSHLWGRCAPATGLVFYGNALPAILQRFSCVCHADVAEGTGLAHAPPRAFRPPPAIAPGRMSYTSTPLHALSTRDLHVPPKAALRCAYGVDPTGGQRVPSPRQHTTSSATRARPRRGILAYPRVFHSHPVQKLGTGDQDAYL